MTADEIVAAARECLGTPFRHQGRVAGRALDCAGLVIHVARRLAIPHEDFEGYGRHPGDGRLHEILDGQAALVRIPIAAAGAGDILCLRIAGHHPQHLAIHAGRTMIHAHALAHKVVEHGIYDWWQRRIVRAYRFRELAA